MGSAPVPDRSRYNHTDMNVALQTGKEQSVSLPDSAIVAAQMDGVLTKDGGQPGSQHPGAFPQKHFGFIMLVLTVYAMRDVMPMRPRR
jgi:hypothetical protein